MGSEKVVGMTFLLLAAVFFIFGGATLFLYGFIDDAVNRIASAGGDSLNLGDFASAISTFKTITVVLGAIEILTAIFSLISAIVMFKELY